MDHKSGLTALALGLALAAICPSLAMAHGKPIAIGSMDDAAHAYGPGARLAPMEPAEKEGVSWFNALSPAGVHLGLVGVARETTDHGYLAQATCVDMEGKIIGVILLRVMEDEKAQVAEALRTKAWLQEGAKVKLSGAGHTLLRSVGKTRASAQAILRDHHSKDGGGAKR